MRHGSLFSGIGGFDLAAEWAGWENIFHCEWNDFGQKILHHYWPNAIQYNDITKTDFTIHRGEIDILTGGFPCQPYSNAGKRLGKEDDRHLWPHMLRAIQEIKPRWVVGENVLGLVNWNDGLVFQEVCADLEAEGYEVQPFVLPAASKGAPHSRQRVWFVAFNVSNTNNNGLNKRNCGNEKQSSQGGQYAFGDIDKINGYGDTTDTDIRKQEQSAFNSGMGRFGESIKENSWSLFPTESPICGGDDGLPTELDGITFPKWRKESLMGYGNAIVPQVAYTIFETINAYERPI